MTYSDGLWSSGGLWPFHTVIIERFYWEWVGPAQDYIFHCQHSMSLRWSGEVGAMWSRWLCCNYEKNLRGTTYILKVGWAYDIFSQVINEVKGWAFQATWCLGQQENKINNNQKKQHCMIQKRALHSCCLSTRWFSLLKRPNDGWVAPSQSACASKGKLDRLFQAARKAWGGYKCSVVLAMPAPDLFCLRQRG